MHRNKTSLILYVWVPLGLESGVGSAGTALIYHLLVIAAAWLMLEKILGPRGWRGSPKELGTHQPRRKRREK